MMRTGAWAKNITDFNGIGEGEGNPGNFRWFFEDVSLEILKINKTKPEAERQSHSQTEKAFAEFITPDEMDETSPHMNFKLDIFSTRIEEGHISASMTRLIATWAAGVNSSLEMIPKSISEAKTAERVLRVYVVVVIFAYEETSRKSNETA